MHSSEQKLPGVLVQSWQTWLQALNGFAGTHRQMEPWLHSAVAREKGNSGGSAPLSLLFSFR
jgi:hypothetical protein